MVIQYSIKLQIHQINNSQSIFCCSPPKAIMVHMHAFTFSWRFSFSLMMQFRKCVWVMFDEKKKAPSQVKQKYVNRSRYMQLNHIIARLVELKKKELKLSWEYFTVKRNNCVKQMICLEIFTFFIFHTAEKNY